MPGQLSKLNRFDMVHFNLICRRPSIFIRSYLIISRSSPNKQTKNRCITQSLIIHWQLHVLDQRELKDLLASNCTKRSSTFNLPVRNYNSWRKSFLRELHLLLGFILYQDLHGCKFLHLTTKNYIPVLTQSSMWLCKVVSSISCR